MLSEPGPAEVLTTVERSLVEHFGVRPSRASVSFVGVESIDVLRFDSGAAPTSYVTLGMSRRPMVGADATALSTVGTRAELLVEARGEAAELWRQLAVLAAAPAVEGVVYRDGMTVDLGTPIAAGSRCTGGLVMASGVASVATGGGARGSDVAILRIVPATSAELAWCRVRGATALRDRWERQGVDLCDLDRMGVNLA